MSCIKAHRSIFFKPIFRKVGEELNRLFQERRLDNDMLQQGELRVMWCKQEGSSRVYLDCEVRRIKRVDLFVESSIRVAKGKIVALHLPSHSISFLALLDVRKVTKRTTAGGK